MDCIIKGDCLQELDKFQPNSIHFCLTDPPYGLDKLSNGWNPDEVHSQKNMKTIKSLPSGMKFDPEQGKNLYNWMLPLSQKIYNALVPGGFYLIFCAPRLYHRVACAAEDAGFHIKDMYLWLYTQNQPKAMGMDYWISKSKSFSEEEKTIFKDQLSGWKTPQVRSNHEPIVFAQKPLENGFLNNFVKYGVGLVNTNEKVGEDKFPSNILASLAEKNEDEYLSTIQKHFLVGKPSKEERKENIHKTVKPLEICEKLISLFSQKDQIVLDPFAGSGTTLVAAKKTGRKYLGIELNSQYVEIINSRLAKV